MVLTAALGRRRLPTTLLTPTVLTPFLTGDDTLRLGTTCVENYWVLSLASLRARRYASVRFKQCGAEAADQQREQREEQEYQEFRASTGAGEALQQRLQQQAEREATNVAGGRAEERNILRQERDESITHNRGMRECAREEWVFGVEMQQAYEDYIEFLQQHDGGIT